MIIGKKREFSVSWKLINSNNIYINLILSSSLLFFHPIFTYFFPFPCFFPPFFLLTSLPLENLALLYITDSVDHCHIFVNVDIYMHESESLEMTREMTVVVFVIDSS